MATRAKPVRCKSGSILDVWSRFKKETLTTTKRAVYIVGQAVALPDSLLRAELPTLDGKVTSHTKVLCNR